MMSSNLKFADATKDFDGAKIVILGVPFDATASFRSGAKLAPNAIREASFNFESYLPEHDLDLAQAPVCDLGNLEEQGSVDRVIELVEQETSKLLEQKKFLCLLGGEHSLTIGAVKAHSARYKNISVLILDAHLDFRNEYLGVPNSHACTARRVSEIVSLDNIFMLGVRSLSKEESLASEKLGLKYHTASEVKEKNIVSIIKNLDLKEEVYLSLDFDVLDPAYAPGVSNPEPLGLNPKAVLDCIWLVAPKLVGFDLVEVCPPYDNGAACLLAAKTVQNLLAASWRESLSGK